MQTKFLRLYLLLAIGASLTACSSSTVVQDNTAAIHTPAIAKAPLQKKVIKKRVKKKIIITKKVTKKVAKKVTKKRIRKTTKKIVQRTNPRRYVSRKKTVRQRYKKRYTSAPQRRAFVQKRTVQKRYKPRHRPVYRKQTVVRRPPVRRPVQRRYSPRKRPVYRKQVSRSRPRSHYKRKVVRRITPQPRRNYGNASFARSLSNAAVARTYSRVRYDGRYVNIRYPWGDVPSNIGVCTDVVIRSYRRLGIDLQKEVHEDMKNGGFYDYPNVKKWGLSSPDKNIDHRRVYNLQAFFRRHGAQLPITHNPTHYKPGDVVSWMVGPNLPHIGIVVEQRSKADPRRHMIVHNISRGPEMEDMLFRFRITGHYRYNKNNRLIAPRRFAAKKPANTVQYDYQRLMRELSRAPVRKQRKSRRIQVARQSRSAISNEEIRAVLGN